MSRPGDSTRSDGLESPRFVGIRTFARRPYVRDLTGADTAIVGVPFDSATSFRPGARFGPEAVRAASMLIRPYLPALEVDVFASRSVIDYGDLDITPGNVQKTLDQIVDGLEPLVTAGVTPIVLGGDHSIVLGELRAHAAAHGPLGLVLLDAHADTWDVYYGTERYFHGTPFRRAVEEELLDPERSVLAGMRGSIYDPEDLKAARNLGFDLLTDEELRELTPAAYGERVRDRLGGGAAYFSFDIDVIDPAFAPGTGTPEVAGLSPREALDLVRALAGVSFVGYDLVEVSPSYDGPGQVTALLAANVVQHFLALDALA